MVQISFKNSAASLPIVIIRDNSSVNTLCAYVWLSSYLQLQSNTFILRWFEAFHHQFYQLHEKHAADAISKSRDNKTFPRVAFINKPPLLLCKFLGVVVTAETHSDCLVVSLFSLICSVLQHVLCKAHLGTHYATFPYAIKDWPTANKPAQISFCTQKYGTIMN